MAIFMFWVVLSILVGVLASKKGRSGAGFFFLSLCLSPIIGLIAVLAAEKKIANIAAREGLVKCPHCAEFIKGEAQVCRFCGRDVKAPATSPAPPTT